MISVAPHIQIDESELEERFVRASGPGGQNVNKTATAVQLRLNVRLCNGLPEPVRARLLRIASGQINSEGELVIDARRYRSQDRNRSDARKRLEHWIKRATEVPKKRKATRPSRAAKERRLQKKKQRGRNKALRKKPGKFD